MSRGLLPGFLRILACLLPLVLAGGVGAAAQSEMVIAREGTSVYHRPGCDDLADMKGVLAMTRAQAEGRKLTPHAQCDPAKGGISPDGSKRAKPAMVLIDLDGKYYHGDKCEKLSDETKRVTVTEASKKHWPCRFCKPPIRPRPKK